jgi:hypothetical protein
VRRSWPTHTHQSTARNPSASTRCAAAAPHRPVATSNGSPQAQPTGVQDATCADLLASNVVRSAAIEPVVSRRLKPSGTSVTRETTKAPRIRPNRLVMTRASALVTARESSTAVSTPSTAATRAATAVAGVATHAPTWANANAHSIRAGMPVSAAASRPRASSWARRGSTENRAGSRMASTPVAMRLSTAHISVITVNNGTTSAVTRNGCPTRSTSEGPRMPTTTRAARPPTIDEVSCRVLRLIAVRHMARRSRTMSRVTASAVAERRATRSAQP